MATARFKYQTKVAGRVRLNFTTRLFTLLSLILVVSCSSKLPPCPPNASPTLLIDRQTLLNDLKILSADSMEGRKVGTKGSANAQDFIAQRFQQIKLKSFEENFRHFFKYGSDQQQGVNMIAWLKGKQYSDQYIVVTAHYDHLGKKGSRIFNGADDNASGVSAMLSLAEYLSKNVPRRSVIFVATDAEEDGLHGAKAFIKNPPVELEQIKYNFNLDMVARGGYRKRLYLAGTRKNKQLNSLAAKSINQAKVCLRKGHEGRTRIRGASVQSTNWDNASDHSPFVKKKIPYLYFGVDLHKDYHQPSDTFENINADFFTASVETIVNTFRLLDQEPIDQ
ncbi:M20/M25/M40 family metallo-hydrolase [Aliikangiella coralliicola]|uniref:M28 family peptidase n=1 Tax=Aliikangiella coralliicola TaxID=2592383 RepID=A0A545UE02_9GAMM|nr:M20/M25/M40 family metallo-hydrolase [Aliikangiella coralliicola]TQV87690.1 M28 family peptidase [Aliikangiella coralliicola]